jgi:hypothetical protein
MRFVRPAALIALLATSAISVPALASGPTAQDKANAAAALVTLSKLNVAIQQDWKFNGGGEVEGKVWVGRDALQTGGSTTTQIGFGASNGQSTVASTYNTVTVGRNANIGFQIKNSVGGAYGAYIVGNSTQEINVQDNGTSSNRVNVTIGGTSSGGVKVKDYQNTTIGGSYTNQNGLDLATNGNVWIGGDLSKAQGGNTNTIKVHGNATQLYVNDNSTAQVGGTIGQGQSGNNTTVTALGNISNFGINGVGTVKTNGSFSNGYVSGNGSKLYAKGGTSNTNNNTGQPTASTIYTGSNVFSGGVTAPADPGTPTVASTATETATMFDNFAALSKSLANLAKAGHTGTIDTSNSQAYKFVSAATSGYTVFNVNENIFNRNEFAYNFANTTTPIIINVKNTGACSATLSCSYTMTSNFTGNANAYNQNVIWNFLDAKDIVLNRQFQGTVLAYLSDLQANVIEGSVVAKNFTMTNEIHLGTYSGNNGFILAGVIPEPANWAMMIAGFGVVGGVVRRRRRSILITA